MPIIIKPVEILKNQDNIFQLDKDALAAESKVSSDAYFSDQLNWKRVIIAYLTDIGNQVEFLTFNTSLETPIASFRVSDKARDVWQVDAIIIQDFDGGYLRFNRDELTTAEFDVNFQGEQPPEPPVVSDQSIIFDNSAYLVSSSNLLIANPSLSISFWYKDNITDPSEKTIFESDTGLVIKLTGNTFLQVDSTGAGGGGNIQLQTEYPSDGKWHHIVLTANPAGNPDASLYIDGVVSDIDSLVSINGLELGNINIGQGIFNSASKLTGSLATLEIWNGVLSSNEVINLYNNGAYISDPSSITTTPILHHWSMGDDALDIIEAAPNVTNTIIKDKIGNVDLQGAEITPSSGTLVASPDLPIADVFRSVSFDGTASLNTSTTIVVGASMTISLWFKNQKTTAISGIFSSGGNFSTERSLYIDNTAPTPELTVVYPKKSFQPTPFIAIPFPHDNNWHHIVIKSDEAGGLLNGETVQLYVDGVYQSGTNSPIGIPNIVSLGIGRSNGGYFEGGISSFQIWNHALADLDITNLYNGGSELKNPSTVISGGFLGDNLLHHWSMGDNPDDVVFASPSDVTNSVIIDQSGDNDLSAIENPQTAGQGTLTFSTDLP